MYFLTVEKGRYTLACLQSTLMALRPKCEQNVQMLSPKSNFYFSHCCDVMGKISRIDVTMK